MQTQFSLFQSHLDLAHQYWKSCVSPGDLVIDATCGNGHDTFVLAKLALNEMSGQVISIDKQAEAIDSARKLLESQLPKEAIARIQLIQGCHTEFPTQLAPETVKLIVYNLGYLPGGDKSITTETGTTIISLKNAADLVTRGGVISVTCYPGHSEGKREEERILAEVQQWPPQRWSCCHHRWTNRKNAPSLLVLQKKITDESQSQHYNIQ